MEGFVRCVFCLPGNEQITAVQIESRGLGRVIVPRKVKPFHANGQWTDRTELLMPGYLFIFSESAYPYGRLQAADGVVHVLTYGEKDLDGFLQGQDLQFAKWLEKEEGLICKLDAVQEGDFVRISDGALQKMQGRVIGMNRRRHTVQVEITLFGAVRSVWLGYEVIEK